MVNINRVTVPPGRGWGIAALIAAVVPVPFLFALNILSLVIRSSEAPAIGTPEAWIYGLIAAIGLLFFPIFFILGVLFSVLAITRTRRAGRVMGVIALAVIVISVPFILFGYLVWILP